MRTIFGSQVALRNQIVWCGRILPRDTDLGCHIPSGDDANIQQGSSGLVCVRDCAFGALCDGDDDAPIGCLAQRLDQIAALRCVACAECLEDDTLDWRCEERAYGVG